MSHLSEETMQTRPSDRFATLAVHAGQKPDATSGAIMTPIYQTSTYLQDGVGVTRGGHEYARVRNPTRTALEGNLAALEGGPAASAFSSGLAAIEASLKTCLSAGDHIVCGDNVYGGTERLLRFYERFGIAFDSVNTSDPQTLEDAMRPETKLVMLETPTNPLMRLSDIAACAEIAHRGNALLAVDNTFATPYLQRPLTLGADLVVHSTTKYIGGHSDLLGGVVISATTELGEAIARQQMVTGAVPGPMDCYLLLRSIKTLPLRMKAHCENAARIVEFLGGRKEPERILYPGLPDSEGHEVACRQMTGFGGMVTIDMVSRERAERLVAGLRLFALAESLGGVESLVCVPARMTHASVPPDRRAATGLTDGLVRLSVGIEDADDLIADLAEALEGV
ncbi:MAG: aminotransferase class V-fold PLP-dependent enzyme [Gemmatimonadales bacterium]|nr:MAG: aminotransferase class V-fold PLP-dependent enzyme [Gemmatimonadales bacterium]